MGRNFTKFCFSKKRVVIIILLEMHKKEMMNLIVKMYGEKKEKLMNKKNVCS